MYITKQEGYCCGITEQIAVSLMMPHAPLLLKMCIKKLASISFSNDP